MDESTSVMHFRILKNDLTFIWTHSTSPLGARCLKPPLKDVISPFAFAPSGMVFLKLFFGKLIFSYFRSVYAGEAGGCCGAIL